MTVVAVGLLGSASAQSPGSLAARPDSVVVPLDSLIQPYLRENGPFVDYDTRVNGFLGTPAVHAVAGQAVAGVLAALFFFGVVGIHHLRRALKHSRAQERRQVELRRRLADSREKERFRLARALYEGPFQDLQALWMQLDIAERRPQRRSIDTSEEDVVGGLTVAVERVQDELLRVGSELRDISERLWPPVQDPGTFD